MRLGTWSNMEPSGRWSGGANRDILVGGSGDDTLVSGGGADVMQGGDGSNTFKLGSSNVTIDKIGEAHGDVTMIRDFVSADDTIDLSALDIADVNVKTLQDAGRTYVVSDTHVLAELMSTSETTIVAEDVILPVV